MNFSVNLIFDNNNFQLNKIASLLNLMNHNSKDLTLHVQKHAIKVHSFIYLLSNN